MKILIHNPVLPRTSWLIAHDLAAHELWPYWTRLMNFRSRVIGTVYYEPAFLGIWHEFSSKRYHGRRPLKFYKPPGIAGTSWWRRAAGEMFVVTLHCTFLLLRIHDLSVGHVVAMAALYRQTIEKATYNWIRSYK
jgi:hypothetical protein